MFILIASFLIALWMMLTPGSLSEIWGSTVIGLGLKISWTGMVILFPILGSVGWILS